MVAFLSFTCHSKGKWFLLLICRFWVINKWALLWLVTWKRCKSQGLHSASLWVYKAFTSLYNTQTHRDCEQSFVPILNCFSTQKCNQYNISIRSHINSAWLWAEVNVPAFSLSKCSTIHIIPVCIQRSLEPGNSITSRSHGQSETLNCKCHFVPPEVISQPNYGLDMKLLGIESDGERRTRVHGPLSLQLTSSCQLSPFLL